MSWDIPPLPARLTGLRRVPLVGRAHERAVLEEAWALAEKGQRQALFIGGEPGVGKTRLAGEAAISLHSQDVTILAGASTPDPGVPHRPFVDALNHLLAHLPQGALERSPAEVLSLLTGRADRTEERVPSSRRELYDAVAVLLRDVARHSALLLLLDDLHWATPDTLGLLAHLIGSNHDAPMLVLGTFRTTVPDRSEDLTAHLADLHRLEGVRRLDLAGLDTDAICEYLRLQGDMPVAEARSSATVLRDMTGGNPFLLREVWSDLSQEGGVPALRGARLPPSIQDTLQMRLARLGESPRKVLELAAVSGEEFEVSTLVREDPDERGRVLAAIDAATVANLIQPATGRGGSYAFVHSLTRQAVLDGMPTSRRMELHASVARSLEAGGPDPERLPALAEHYLAAQDLGYEKQAVRYATDAAELAERSLAYEEAANWFTRAASVPVGDSSERASLLLRSADNNLRSGDFVRARETYESLMTTTGPEMRLKAAMGYEAASWRPGLPATRAAEYLTEALDAFGDDLDSPRHVMAVASLGRALAFTGALDEARRVGVRALGAARRLGDPATLTHSLETALWHGLSPEVLDSQLRRSTELAEMSRTANDAERLAVASHFRAICEYMRGHAEQLEAAATDLRQAATASGQPFFEYVAECVAQGRAFLNGDFVGARRRIETALRIGATFGADTTEGSYGVQMFILERESGDLESLRPRVTGEEPFHGRWVAGLLALYTELEIEIGARRALRYLLNRDLESLTVEAQWPMELVFMTEGALFLRDQEAAVRLLSHMGRYSGTNLIGGQFVALFGSADRFSARLAALLGEWDTAERHFQQALQLDRRTGSVVHSAETLAYHALFLAGRGEEERARAMAEEARGLAEPIGHRRPLRVLLALPTGPGPAGLTEREVEVLALLAQGLSNRQIADRLYISANTAANHLRSIFTKTGTSNRTQAAMYAADVGLL